MQKWFVQLEWRRQPEYGPNARSRFRRVKWMPMMGDSLVLYVASRYLSAAFVSTVGLCVTLT